MSDDVPVGSTLGRLKEEAILPRRMAAKSARLSTARIRIASFLAFLAIWSLVALAFGPSVVPGPHAVVSTLISNLQIASTYTHIGVTVWRVVGGMLLAVGAGVVVGVIMGISPRAEVFLDNWVMVTLTIPSIVFGIVAILWFGINNGAAIWAIGITCFPVVALNMWQAVKAMDWSVIDMARAFRLPRNVVIRRVIVPQTTPYILASLRYALGISWKIATVVELIGMPNGVGYMLNYWFGNFSMTQVLAWTLKFTLVLLLLETAVMKPLERHFTRWRPTASRSTGTQLTAV